MIRIHSLRINRRLVLHSTRVAATRWCIWIAIGTVITGGSFCIGFSIILNNKQHCTLTPRA